MSTRPDFPEEEKSACGKFARPEVANESALGDARAARDSRDARDARDARILLVGWAVLFKHLAYGLVLALVTAWACALAPLESIGRYKTFTLAPFDYGDKRSTGHTVPSLLVSAGEVQAAWGRVAWKAQWQFGACGIVGEWRRGNAGQYQAEPPSWSGMAEHTERTERDRGIVLAYGVPMACVRMEHGNGLIWQGNGWLVEGDWSGTMRVANGQSPEFVQVLLLRSSRSFGQLPLHPIWIGLLVNTLAWAAIAFAITTARRATRWFEKARRRNEQRCIVCRHMASSADEEICPECGTRRQDPVGEQTIGRIAGGCCAVLAALCLVVLVWYFAGGGSAGAPYARLWPALLLPVVSMTVLYGVWLHARDGATRWLRALTLAQCACGVAWASWVCVSLVQSMDTTIGYSILVWPAQLGILPAMIIWIRRPTPTGQSVIVRCAAATAFGVAVLGALASLTAPPNGPSVFRTLSSEIQAIVPGALAILGLLSAALVTMVLRIAK